MIKEALAALRDAAQSLRRAPAHLLVFVALYLLLFVACYLFITTKEATAPQLLLTALTAIAAPALLLLIQAGNVNYTRLPVADSPVANSFVGSAGSLLRRAARDMPKLLLVSLPLVLLGVALAYLLGKLQVQSPLPAQPPPVRTYPVTVTPPAAFAWSAFLFSALRLALLGIALPLLTIHTWLAVARRGLGATARNFGDVFRSAFAARSVTIYTLGLLLFAVLPYFLIFTRTTVSHPWLELVIFGLRITLVFALTLFGWVITTGALASVTYNERPPDAPGTPATATAHASVPPLPSNESAPATT